MQTIEGDFVCPFCGPAPQDPAVPRRCTTCGRRCGAAEARAAGQAWHRGPTADLGTTPRRSRPDEAHLVVVVARSSVIAALLSLLWLGAGHVYAGRHRTGAVLVAANLLLWLASGVGVPLAVTASVWAAAACAAAVSSARAARTAPGAVFRA